MVVIALVPIYTAHGNLRLAVTALMPIRTVHDASQAVEQAAVTAQADVIAFDRANHMGMSKETVNSIKSAITSEAAAAHARQGASSVMNIKENEDRLATLKAFWMPSKAPDVEVKVRRPDLLI